MANSNRTTGIGFWGALALMFIAFKITGFIDWSWWLVLAPIWGPIALLAAIMLLFITWASVLDWDGER